MLVSRTLRTVCRQLLYDQCDGTGIEGRSPPQPVYADSFVWCISCEGPRLLGLSGCKRPQPHVHRKKKTRDPTAAGFRALTAMEGRARLLLSEIVFIAGSRGARPKSALKRTVCFSPLRFLDGDHKGIRGAHGRPSEREATVVTWKGGRRMFSSLPRAKCWPHTCGGPEYKRPLPRRLPRRRRRPFFGKVFCAGAQTKLYTSRLLTFPAV